MKKNLNVSLCYKKVLFIFNHPNAILFSKRTSLWPSFLAQLLPSTRKIFSIGATYEAAKCTRKLYVLQPKTHIYAARYLETVTSF